MTTINNLTIEQMREIVSGAPNWANIYDPQVKDYYRGGAKTERDYWLEDLRTAIAQHDLKPCSHGFDIACLLCGFGTESGVRVWRKEAERHG